MTCDGQAGTDTGGPLAGLRVVEIAGLGPTPFAAMWLAEMGADVVRITRPGQGHVLGLEDDWLDRGRDWLALDLKSDAGHRVAHDLIARADAVIEGMRPGVMERLRLGPDDFPENPALVYGRMTGWGQEGPLASFAGHDITYIALTGALHAIGPAESPIPPLNLLGDFGGGSMYLIAGMLAALLAARISGQGQVVDAAICDGTAHLMTMISGMARQGAWQDRREANMLDGAAPWYRCYRCSCGGHVAVGALEPQFYAALLAGLGLDPALLPARDDRAQWPAITAALAEAFGARSRDHWAAHFAQSDACVAPVLHVSEAADHPHAQARGTYIDGAAQPAPRLSRQPGRIRAASEIGPAEALARWTTKGH